MALALTEEQQILQSTAREFIAANAPVTHLRGLRDGKDATGFSRDLWAEMAKLGWAGLIEDEANGGSALGFGELAVLFEECGRKLAPSPFLASVVLAGGCVRAGAPAELRNPILSGVARGETLLALALDEGATFAPYAVTAKAEKSGDGWVLTGEKTFVLDGHVADRLVVVARTSGSSGDRDGLTLFLVDAPAKGLTITRTTMVDNRNAATVKLDGVAAEVVLGTVDQGADVLDPVLDRATAVFCAEMLGLMTEAFEHTIEYLKTREQFGVKIGTFQGLKHRAAAMFAELELSRSVVRETVSAIDDDGPDVPTLVCVAKARCSDAVSLIAREMLQMHGGIGMTDEADIGFYLKRARVQELTFGDASYHRDRFATLQGY
ncbi:MAG: acyl-CoA dehydrogenase [Candidatus Binatia bacterium]|nr:acyl-CoA dehydrogenase [Candidatus Binatia bacterium]